MTYCDKFVTKRILAYFSISTRSDVMKIRPKQIYLGNDFELNTLDLGLSPTGVIPGTYNQVVVNTKGRVTLGQPASFKPVGDKILPTTGTTTISLNNNAPSKTSGTQIYSKTITPTVITSEIEISVNLLVDVSTSNIMVLTLWRDNTLLGTMAQHINLNASGLLGLGGNFPAGPHIMSFDFVDLPESTQPVTYTIRAATTGSGTWYINRLANATLGGSAALNSGIRFKEYI